eukprot:UN24746
MHLWYVAGVIGTIIVDYFCGRNFHLFLIIISIPGFLAFCMGFANPENPQFLLKNGKLDDVQLLLDRLNVDQPVDSLEIVTVNKNETPLEVFKTPTIYITGALWFFVHGVLNLVLGCLTFIVIISNLIIKLFMHYFS